MKRRTRQNTHPSTMFTKDQFLQASNISVTHGNQHRQLHCHSADKLPPVLRLPEPITVEATNSSGAVVTYATTTSDPAYPTDQLTITCAQPSVERSPSSPRRSTVWRPTRQTQALQARSSNGSEQHACHYRIAQLA